VVKDRRPVGHISRRFADDRPRHGPARRSVVGREFVALGIGPLLGFPTEADGMAKSRGLITDTEKNGSPARSTSTTPNDTKLSPASVAASPKNSPKNILEEHHPELLHELQETVCDISYYCPRCGKPFDRPSDAHQHALHQCYQDDEHAEYETSEAPQWWPLEEGTERSS
jgi:hypothetical protein